MAHYKLTELAAYVKIPYAFFVINFQSQAILFPPILIFIEKIC